MNRKSDNHKRNVRLAVAMPEEVHPLTALGIIVVLSLVVAAVLFGILSSTGFVKNQYIEFGGAAGAFFVALWSLGRWYDRMVESRGSAHDTKLQEKIEKLEEENKELVEEKRRLTEALSKPAGPLDASEFGDEKIDGVLDQLRERHGIYRKILPPSDLLPILRKLFYRNTFNEKIEECVSQDWMTRLRVACLTEKVLQTYSQSIADLGTSNDKKLYEALQAEVRKLCQNMIGLFEPHLSLAVLEQHLDNVEEFKKHLSKPLPKDKIEQPIVQRCDTNLEKISSLWNH